MDGHSHPTASFSRSAFVAPGSKVTLACRRSNRTLTLPTPNSVRSNASTVRAQHIERGTHLFEMSDLAFDLAAFDDGLRPHVGAIGLRVGFECKQLGDFPE